MGLLRQRNFGPFFWTQFFGAFNDNLFKSALLIVIAFTATSEAESGLFVNLASGLFILPFFLLSPFAGQLSDKYEKSKFIRIIKLAEIAIMFLASIGFWFSNSSFLMAVLFCMGAQSAFFGPVKYSIIPQHLPDRQIMEGTGLVEMGTFVAILLGTIVGGILAKGNLAVLGFVLLFISLIGYLSSRFIPSAEPAAQNLQITLNPLKQFRSIYRAARQQKAILLSIFGISWFWFLGATFLAQMPNFVKYFINGDQYMVSFFLGVFTISMAIGAIISNKLSDATIELGLVGVGAIGLTVFTIDISLIDFSVFKSQAVLFENFFRVGGMSSFRVIVDLIMIGIFGSLYNIPLYALVQHRSGEETCSQVIAANNVLNAIFMVGSALMTMFLFKWGLGPLNGYTSFDTSDIFLTVGLMNIFITMVILFLLPQFFLRFVLWGLAKLFYSLRYQGREKIPLEGPVMIVANHVSYVDWFIISATCQRPMRFVLTEDHFTKKAMKLFHRLIGSIVLEHNEDGKISELSLNKITEALNDGDVIGIFPEGSLTHDGKLHDFSGILEEILAVNKVTVVPVATYGLWHSAFSFQSEFKLADMLRLKRRRVDVLVGDPKPPTVISVEVHDKILEMICSLK